MRHPPMSFCAGFYYYQGEVKNARKLRILDCRMQIVGFLVAAYLNLKSEI